MLSEYRDTITLMKQDPNNAMHFKRVFGRHNELDELITEAQKNPRLMTDLEIEELKKEKLHLKDEAYRCILKYKKKHNL
jgi:uncharacterized protein YdcH (DUF465 family)